MQTTWTRRSFLSAGSAALVRLLPAQQIKLARPGPIRVGIIGLEGHVGEVTGAVRFVPGIQIAAIAASKPREVQRFSSNKAYAGAKRYDDYLRMLDSEKLDVVAICDENGRRPAAIVACAERGIPVAAEKPLALTLHDLDTVKKAVARRKVPLTMLLTMRFETQYPAMKALVERGEIGEPVSLSAQKSYKLGLDAGQRPDWMRKRATYGGTIPYIGIHMVDLMRWIGGREFVEAAAFQSTVGFPQLGDMENNTAVIFRLDNRGTANLRMDYLRPETAPTHGDDRLRIAGTKGVIEYQGGAITLITADGKPRVVTERPPQKSLFADFLESIYNGKKPVIPVEDVYRVTEIVLRAREAAETNKVVRL